MAESSILLAPSRTREGFSLVAAEAASVGTPCIVSDIGGLPETVEHEVTGLVVPNENVEAFAHSIRLTLSDPSFWFQLSMQSYDRSRERFDLARCIESYASAYRKVVANGGAIAKMECR
jgi:glycosyltransferase involved in cell wall biosynthesis